MTLLAVPTISTSTKICLPEISRSRQQVPQHLRVIDELAGDHVNHFTLDLQFSLNAHEPRIQQCRTMIFCNLFPDYQVDMPGLILQRDKGDATGRSRPLFGNNETCNIHGRTADEIR